MQKCYILSKRLLECQLNSLKMLISSLADDMSQMLSPHLAQNIFFSKDHCSAFVHRFVQTFFTHYEYELVFYFHLKIEMLTDRSPLLCDFSMLGNFSPISLVHLPKSLTIKSFSGANLYISQILAKFFSINIQQVLGICVFLDWEKSAYSKSA